MGRLRKSIFIFIALCIYERALYGYFSVLNDFALNQYFGGFALFLCCVVFLSLEDSLGSLLAYEECEKNDKEKKESVTSSVFLFGIIDQNMLTCCKMSLTITCGRYKIHFVRLLYYNMHGILFTLAWCGMDSTIGWVMSKLTDWETGPRVATNFLILFLSNCGLISLHQMAGQFGVEGSHSDVIADEDDDYVTTENNQVRYIPPEVELTEHNSKIIVNSNFVGEEKTQSQGGGVEQATHLSFAQHLVAFLRSRPLRSKVRASMSERHLRQAKILLTFICVTMFWSAIWDLFSSLPKEELTADDDNDDMDDYDRHNTGDNANYSVLIVGICYVLVAFVYLALSGELFSFVATDDEEPDHTAESSNLNCITRWLISHRRYFVSVFPPEIIDKSYKCCNCRIRLFRLIDYNLKGIALVIAWIGIVLVVISLEEKLIFSSTDKTTAASCAIYATWLLVANYIFIFYDALEDIYGSPGAEGLSVVEVWTEKTEEDKEQRSAGSSSPRTLDEPLLQK